jgi:Leucine-rich repeat (LRR) protein
MTDGSPRPSPTPPRRSRFRFSLRTLLIALTIFACLVGWNMHRRHEQQRALAAVQQLGGTTQQVLVDLSLPSRIGAVWTQENSLWLANLQLTDEDLDRVPLEAMHTLRGFHAADNRLTDRSLARLAGRSELESLDLTNNPDITDEGLAQLKNLRGLKQLMLRNNPRITDAGLIHLESLQNLDLLILIGTSVTPTGGKQLQSKLPTTKVGY